MNDKAKDAIDRIGRERIIQFISSRCSTMYRPKLIRELKAEFNLNPGESEAIYFSWSTYTI